MPPVLALSAAGKWTHRFFELAEFVAGWSKDPSTKCGAVIVNGKRVVSMGFNGFPQGVNDDLDLLGDREAKYEMVVHADVNAILFAERTVTGCTMFTWPIPPCSRCASIIVQSGIMSVVSPVPEDDAALWHRMHCDRTVQILDQAGVMLHLYNVKK